MVLWYYGDIITISNIYCILIIIDIPSIQNISDIKTIAIYLNNEIPLSN